MEKTITIDGKQVRFKSTAATPRRYRAQFGSDFFQDIYKLVPIIQLAEKEDGLENASYESLKYMNFELFENIAWVLAKTADKSIPEPMEWLDQFDEFPIEIMVDLMELITHSFEGKKNANHPALKGSR